MRSTAGCPKIEFAVRSNALKYIVRVLQVLALTKELLRLFYPYQRHRHCIFN